MIGKTDKNPQLNVFRTPLVSVINMKHELVELAQRIDWKSVEKDFAPYLKRLRQIRDAIYFVLDLLTGHRPIKMQLY